MGDDSLFLSLAVAGAVLGGLGGVAGVLRQAAHVPTSREAAGLKLIVEHAFALTFFALLPRLVEAFGGVSVWAQCSLFLSLFLGLELLLQTRRVEATTHRKGSHAAFVRVMLYSYGVPTIVAYMFQVANFWRGAFPVYLLGLVWLLVTAMVQFWLFVVYDRHPDER